MTEGQKLSVYVGREPTEKELGEQWDRIGGRLGEPSGARLRVRRFALAAALAASFAVLALVFFAHKRAVPSAWDGAIFDSGADHVSVALTDGSHIELMPSSRVAVVEGSPHSVRLDLRKGSAHFDVTHVAGRTFSVKSGNVTIRVVGTRFSVTTLPLPGGQRITVAVDQGVVEAESAPGAEPTRIRAGETWSTVQTETTAPTASHESAPAPVSASAEPLTKRAEEPASAPAPAVVEHPSSAVAIEHPSNTVATEHAAKAEPTAQELFESGSAARQAGDARTAAAAYQTLIKHYPSDARVGLAAFELGRLKMDQLGDTRGAVEALKRAVLAPSSGFREDALARLSLAYGRLGQIDSCERMKSAYLASYPNGVHASAVRQACGGSP